MRSRAILGAAVIALSLLVACGCSRLTARLSPEMSRRLTAEGILRRADDTLVRYTRGSGARGSRWDEWTASIVVTRRTILIHRNEETLLEVTSASAGDPRVRRDHDRLSLHARSGRSSKSWSFRPPDDVAGWAKDMRGVLKAAPGASGADGGGVGD